MTNCNIFRKIPSKIFMCIGLKQDGSLVYQIEIARHLNIPNTTVNYWITKFKQEGLIYKDLRLRDKGKKLFKVLIKKVFSEKRLRAHNIQVKLNIVKCPYNFPNCYLDKQNLTTTLYKPFTNGRYTGLKTELLNCSVMFYSPKKIVCVVSDIYTDSDEEISATVQEFISQLIEAIELEFNGIKVDSYEVAKIQSMHIAVTNSIIAKSILVKRGISYNSDKLAVDNSHGIPELEATDPTTALQDIESLLNLEDERRRNEKVNTNKSN